MADNGALSQHNAAVSQCSQGGNSKLIEAQDAPLGPLPSPATATRRPPPAPHVRASLGVITTGSLPAPGTHEGLSSGLLHGRRVRFNPTVRRSTDFDHTSDNPSTLISPFKTPPIAVNSDSEPSGSYFDAHHGQGTQNEEEGISTPLSPLPPRTKGRSSRQITLEEEVRAALEGLPRENLGGMTFLDKENLVAALGGYSAPVSPQISPVSTPRIPLEIGSRDEAAHQPGGASDTAPQDPEKGLPIEAPIPDTGKEDQPQPATTTEAHKLVRAHTQRSNAFRLERKRPATNLESGGASTPTEGEAGPTHEQMRAGILSSLLKLYNHQNPMPNDQGSSVPGSPTVSGRSTPKWYNKSANNSVASLLGSGLTGSSQALMPAGTPSISRAGSPTGTRTPKHKKRNGGGLSGMLTKMKHPPKSNIADEIRITIHIAKLLQRQKYVLKLCRALMLYGVSNNCMLKIIDEP